MPELVCFISQLSRFPVSLRSGGRTRAVFPILDGVVFRKEQRIGTFPLRTFRRRFTFVTSVIISGEKLGDLEEANPFSFKEFLKSKNLGLSKEDTDSRIYSKVNLRRCLQRP